jgi:hypothetical protein
MTADDRRRPQSREHELGLEHELAELGWSLAYPPTPDLVGSVRAAIVEAPAPRWRALVATLTARPFRRSFVLALGALLLLAGLAIGAAFRLGGLRIVFVDQLPAVPSHAPVSGSLGADLGIGQPVVLSTAISKVDYQAFLPDSTQLGSPDAVYFSQVLAGGQISLVYGARPGLPAPVSGGVAVLVTEFPGGMEEKLAQKSVGPGTTVEVLEVNGGLGFWIEGNPHVLVYRDPTGQYVYESIRLVRSSLAWEQDGTVLRIEGDLSRAQALALAATFRAYAAP